MEDAKRRSSESISVARRYVTFISFMADRAHKKSNLKWEITAALKMLWIFLLNKPQRFITEYCSVFMNVRIERLFDWNLFFLHLNLCESNRKLLLLLDDVGGLLNLSNSFLWSFQSASHWRWPQHSSSLTSYDDGWKATEGNIKIDSRISDQTTRDNYLPFITMLDTEQQQQVGFSFKLLNILEFNVEMFHPFSTSVLSSKLRTFW